MTEREFKLIIMTALKYVHGLIGVAVSFDILKYQQETCRAYIRTNSKLVSFNVILLCCYIIICHSFSLLPISLSQHFILKAY